MIILCASLIIMVVLVFWRRTRLLCLSARMNFRTGKTEKALKLFGIATRLGALDPEDLMYYGYVLLRSGNIDFSRDILTRASINAKKDSLKKRIKSMLALVEWKEGNLELAIELMEDAMVDFKSTNVYQNLGLLYNLRGNGKKALEFNLEAYDYNSEDLVIMDNLAESYALCKNTARAKELYEELLAKEPHFPEPYYSYGLILIAEGEKERGLSLIRESLSKKFSFLSIKSKEEVEALLLEKENE